jgi:hypothetical protein
MVNVLVGREEIENYLQKKVDGLKCVSKKEESAGIILGAKGYTWDDIYAIPETVEVHVGGIGNEHGVIPIPDLVKTIYLYGQKYLDNSLNEIPEVSSLPDEYGLEWYDKLGQGKSRLHKSRVRLSYEGRDKFLESVSEGISNIITLQERFPTLVQKYPGLRVI